MQQYPQRSQQQNIAHMSPIYQQQNMKQQGPSFLLRVVWYLFIGWWLGGLCLSLGYLCMLTIIGIPIGLILLNRLPRVMTLRPASQQTNVIINSAGVVTMGVSRVQQTNFLLRVVYFLFIGWWLGAIWASIGYSLCLTILGLPLGLMMLNRLPAVLTLYRQ